MRMESDDENFQHTKIPNYIKFDNSINYKKNNFFASFLINNILNVDYHNYAVASSSTNGTYNAYPEPGREIIINLGLKY